MEAVARVATEFFMMVLCVNAAPADQQEIRVDVVGNQGYVDTMIVRREEVGFTVHDEMNGKLVRFLTIVPKDDAENVFVCTDHKSKSETVDLHQGIEGLNVSHLRTKPRLRLKATGGMNIAIDRSKEVVFITPDKLKRTYVVH
ncbi:hypothetical protein [uncultured Rubinisphaera sp.]|uniref:hypothetical protein n=1 Tax=uncultured Rubinisphaera sp. TaxID=1678686 RepID=UPI0030D80B7D|tara:strand:+ start:495 stop:923 length:429 start_codon:yes stop_codon:yes gene_type:complete